MVHRNLWQPGFFRENKILLLVIRVVKTDICVKLVCVRVDGGQRGLSPPVLQLITPSPRNFCPHGVGATPLLPD